MKRRIIALLTAAMLLMAICPAALAEPETLPDTEPEALPAEELEPVFLGPQPARAATTMAAARSRDSFFFI